MDSPQAAQTQDRNDGSLSPLAAESSPGRSRAASVKSYRSGTTIVENNLLNGEEDHKSVSQFSRTATLDITIKPVSRLEFFFGLFGPERMTRKIAEKAKVNGVENYEYESSRGSPYIASVYALSTRKDESKLSVPRLARCTIDTGNQQGNFVSKKFLMNDLEYSESDFRSLNSSEKNGGLSASNHKLIPEAAVLITWYHAASPRLFRNMRFLVMSNTQYDLVIGARSITKHNLLSPPNFGVSGSIQFKAETHKEATNLKGEMKKLDNDVITLKQELKKIIKVTPGNTVDIEKKETEIAEKKALAKKATEALEEYEKKHRKEGGDKLPKANGAQTNGHATNGAIKTQLSSTKKKDNKTTEEEEQTSKNFPRGLFGKRNTGSGR